MPSGWDKTRLVQAAQAYADRFDSDTYAELFNTFINIAEDRLSRIIRTRNMSLGVGLPVKAGDNEYPLPVDFDGARSVAINGVAIHYLNPEQLLNSLSRGDNLTYYTIVGNSIILSKPMTGDEELNIVYYRRLPALVDGSDTNWLLEQHGDIYLTAVQAEIEAYVKNDARAQQFWARLDQMFGEIDQRDWEDRWSGTSLATRLETNRGT